MRKLYIQSLCTHLSYSCYHWHREPAKPNNQTLVKSLINKIELFYVFHNIKESAQIIKSQNMTQNLHLAPEYWVNTIFEFTNMWINQNVIEHFNRGQESTSYMEIFAPTLFKHSCVWANSSWGETVWKRRKEKITGGKINPIYRINSIIIRKRA